MIPKSLRWANELKKCLDGKENPIVIVLLPSSSTFLVTALGCMSLGITFSPWAYDSSKG